MRGILVAFEGVDASGLTTHSRLLAERLGARGLHARYYKQPSSGPVGVVIREALRRGGVDNTVLALLFAADRLQQLYGGGGVAETLAAGGVAVVDRYKYSSLAYQTLPLHGVGAAPPWLVEAVNALAPPPHILVHLDPEPSVVAERLRRRGERSIYEDPAVLEALSRRLRGVIDARVPEYCGGPAPWAGRLQEAAGMGPEKLYPGGRCYPALARVRVGRPEPPVEETARLIEAAVLALAERLGLASLGYDEAILREAEGKGILELRVAAPL